MNQMLNEEQFAAFIGIDWADAKHDLCLQAVGCEKHETSILEHTPEAIEAWANTLRRRFGGKSVAICLELSKGPLVYALGKYDFMVLFPVNPLMVARFREAFATSGAKDDPSDAQPQLGQKPRFLQLKATNFSSWQDSQRTLRNPCSSLPHFRYSSNSFMTYAGRYLSWLASSA